MRTDLNAATFTETAIAAASHGDRAAILSELGLAVYVAYDAQNALGGRYSEHFVPAVENILAGLPGAAAAVRAARRLNPADGALAAHRLLIARN